VKLEKDVDIHAYTYLCTDHMTCATTDNGFINSKCNAECPLEKTVYQRISTTMKTCDPQRCEFYDQDTPIIRDSLDDQCRNNKISFADD